MQIYHRSECAIQIDIHIETILEYDFQFTQEVISCQSVEKACIESQINF